MAVNILPEQNELLEDWQEKGGYTYPVFVVSSTAEAVETYAVRSTPTNYLLNQWGETVFRQVGFKGDSRELESTIRQFLNLGPLPYQPAPHR